MSLRSTAENINLVAFKFAKTRDDYLLTDLVTLLLPKLESQARYNSRKYNVPYEDLYSAYLESIYEAAIGYKPIADFEGRWHSFKKKKGADVLKHYRAKKRNAINTFSMNVTIGNEDGNEIEYGDLFEASDSDFTRVVEIEEMYGEFKSKHPKYGEILDLIRKGRSNLEIANFLGEETYNERARKSVSLARKSFEQFLKN